MRLSTERSGSIANSIFSPIAESLPQPMQRPSSIDGGTFALTAPARLRARVGARFDARQKRASVYISGGGVAANSLGMPDLGISTMEDVLTDLRRITDVTTLPVLVDIDTGWGGAFNIARTIRSMEKAGVAAVHMEDQVGTKRCGHRPGKEVVPTAEMI